MAINKNELLKALKADKKEAERLQRDWFIKREGWIAETYAKEYGNEEDGKSKIVSADIKKQLEWILPGITDPFLSGAEVIKCSPVTFEDTHAARQNELLLNTQFCRKFPRYNFIMKAVRVLATEGTVVIQTGWDYQEEVVEEKIEVVESDDFGNEEIKIKKENITKILKNQPTAVVCRNEDIFIDPTCMDNMDNCQFVIHRYETSMSALRSDGRFKNLDKLANEQHTLMEEPDYYREDLTYFEFKDKPRKKLVVHEYWGNYDIDDDGEAEPIVCAWVGNTIIRLESNPYPDKKPPFIIVPFNAIPFQMFGEALAENIGDNQKVKTAITRGIIDNMARSNNGQIGMRKGTLDSQNRTKFLLGENFEYNMQASPRDFYQGGYNEIPSSVFNMLTLMNNEIESQTGVKSFSGGISGNALGNMLDITTDIPMIDGSFKKLAHILDGDIIVGSNGKGTKVIKAHDIKYPKVAYDMSFDNGSIIKSGGEHLWTVKVYGTSHKLREWTTMDANEVYMHIQNGRRVTIPRIKEVQTGVVTGNTISPYVLGFWLGDGNSHSARITTEDLEVLSHFNKDGYDCVEVKDSSKCGNAKMYDVYKKGHTINRDSNGQYIGNGSLHSELKALGLHARYGGYKHIPEEYFTATYEEKMELIRGLMDSDGYAHSGAFVQFNQSEGQLKEDVVRLIESLGLKASIIKRDKDVRNAQKIDLCSRTKAKLILATKDLYEIGFTPWSNPFKLTRKANKWKVPSIETVCIKSMTITDKVLMRCLTVDSEDKLFAVTDKFTLTHNTATGARGALDATATRRLNLVRNIAENMIKPLMRKWVSYNAEFLEEEEIIRITNEEYVPIRRDDLEGRIDVDINISTAEDNAAKVQELSFLLQTLGPKGDPAITRMLMADIYELSRMPDKAKAIREYTPEPDPVQQQIQALQLENMQLENAKLKADIADKYARAKENEIDARLKSAKAGFEEARARKMHSDADMTDLNFLKADQGVPQQEAMARDNAKMELKSQEQGNKMYDAEMARQHELNKMMLEKELTNNNSTQGE